MVHGKPDKEEETEKALALQKGFAPQIMLTNDEVLKVAKLAHLKIADADVERMAGSLSAILDHIGQLNRLDTAGIAPTSHVLGVENVFREDTVTAHFDHAKSLNNAPGQAKNYFSVPRIIE